MESMLFEGKIREIEEAGAIAYILEDDEEFYDIGYRAMQNNPIDCLIDCHKLTYNMKTKFMYFHDQMTSLDQKIKHLETYEIETLLQQLVVVIKEIEDYGFISLECIESRLERIYVDNRTPQIRFLYIPVKLGKASYNKVRFENKICRQLLYLLEKEVTSESNQIRKIIEGLENDKTLQLNDVIEGLLKVATGGTQKEYIGQNSSAIVISAINDQVAFHINGDEFVIGKKRRCVNGLILNNPTVSRVHCKICRVGEIFYLIDLGSSNGTYLNGMRLVPNTPIVIRLGDHIRVSNIEFLVRGNE